MVGAARGEGVSGGWLLLGTLRSRAYRWIEPDLAAFKTAGIVGDDTMPDDIALSEAARLFGIPEHFLNDAHACARLRIPGRRAGPGGVRFSRFGLACWLAVNDPAARLAAWGAERFAERRRRGDVTSTLP